MDTSTLRVAIIGGGVSGLSLAYYLQKLGGKAAQQIEITLFERKATLGGNAETVWVDLGNRRQPGKPESPWGSMMSTWPPIIACARCLARSAS